MEILYAQLTNASIDHGILERAQNIYVAPSYFGWKDLGSWASAYEQTEKDYLGNASPPDSNVLIIDASNCMIKASKNKLIVLQGLDEFIIVDTEDVLLVCERSKEQQIKGYIAEIRRNKGEKYL
jgi:mannose-1-phosphate guanylyltransferase